MMADEIKISKLGFWGIGAVGTALLTGLIVWFGYTNSAISQVQINIATLVSDVSHLKNRVEENLEMSTKINELTADVNVLAERVRLNSLDLESRRGIRFNMPDYDKYVKPQLDSLNSRVSNLESR